jgi:hypothetical protein
MVALLFLIKRSDCASFLAILPVHLDVRYVVPLIAYNACC